MNKNAKLHGYKYTIYDRLRRLPVEDYEVAMQWLPQQLGITRSTFRNWIYTKAKEQLDLPANAILKLSVFFGCDPLELYSYPFSKSSLVEKWEEEKDNEIKYRQSQIKFYESL